MTGTSDALIKKDAYQVFLFVCRATLPFSFAKHPWFVVNRKGVVSRWEILWFPNTSKLGWGHIHKDRYPLFQGIEISPFSSDPNWKEVELIGAIEGGENSLAQKMGECIEDTPHLYYDSYHYSIHDLNSIAYVKWILKECPGSGLRISWNARGTRI